MAIDFSQLEGQGLAKKNLCCSSSFLKGSLTIKNLYIALPNTLGLLFASCFSKVPFIEPFTSF